MFKLPPLKIDLEAKLDKYKQTMHFGKLAFPGTMHFDQGVVFFVFTSEPDFEELLIGSALPNKKAVPIKKSYGKDGKLSRCFIPLDKKMDTEDPPAPYYMAVVRDDDLELDMENGYIFFVFTAKPGMEQLQIVRNTAEFDPTMRSRRDSERENELEDDFD